MSPLYGVLICSQCHRAKGVRLDQRTTKCQCGHTIKLSEAKIQFKTAKALELVDLVAKQNAKLMQKVFKQENEYKPPKKRDTVHSRIAEIAAKAGNRERKMKTVAIELSKRLNCFTYRDFALVLNIIAIPNPKERLEELLRSSFIYEPNLGFFKVI